jgi:hypothetical protein
MTCAFSDTFCGMSDTAARGPHPRLRAQRCTRCHRPSDVLVQDDRGLRVTACVDHLEWAFLTGVDVWTGRWRTA